VLPLIREDEDMVAKARALYEELRRAVVAEYDDWRPDRPPLPRQDGHRHARMP
jgi:hypothetical protein